MSDVADAISEEIPTGGTVGYVADVVQVVCASATIALGVAASLKF